MEELVQRLHVAGYGTWPEETGAAEALVAEEEKESKEVRVPVQDEDK